MPESVPSPMAMGAAPACEPHVAAAASAPSDGTPAATPTLDNGTSAKHPSSKVRVLNKTYTPDFFLVEVVPVFVLEKTTNGVCEV